MLYNDTMLEGKHVEPTDVKVYYENKRPYLDYKGIIETNYGKAEIHFPKMELTIHSIEMIRDTKDIELCSIPVVISNQILVHSNEFCDIKFLERSMTKKEIEKELGYKVNIVGDKNV